MASARGWEWPRSGSVSCFFLQMMQFAWHSYKLYAMGKNELRPLTKDGYEGNMFGELVSGRPTAPLVAEWDSVLSLPPSPALSCVLIPPDPGAPESEFLLGC